MKALVTGANGFIGSFLVERLLKEGIEVRALVRKTSNLRWIKDLPAEIFYGNFSELESLNKAVRDVNFIFHTAAAKRAFTEADYDKINYFGTKNLIKACLQANPPLKRLVYLSSLETVGPTTRDRPVNEETPAQPITFYGSSKLKGETELLRNSQKLPVTIIRAAAVYGPRDEDFLSLFKTIAWHVRPSIGIKPKYISLCYVDDLIEGLWLAARKEEAKGKVYFISDGQLYSYQEFTREIAKALDVWSIKIIIPEALALAIGHINDWLARIKGKPAVLNLEKVSAMVQAGWLCDVSKAKAELGFQARVSLKEGVRRTFDWYNSKGWL